MTSREKRKKGEDNRWGEIKTLCVRLMRFVVLSKQRKNPQYVRPPSGSEKPIIIPIISSARISQMHLRKDLQTSDIPSTTFLTKIFSEQAPYHIDARIVQGRRSSLQVNKKIPTSRFGARRWKYSGGPSDNHLVTARMTLRQSHTNADAPIPECNSSAIPKCSRQHFSPIPAGFPRLSQLSFEVMKNNYRSGVTWIGDLG